VFRKLGDWSVARLPTITFSTGVKHRSDRGSHEEVSRAQIQILVAL